MTNILSIMNSYKVLLIDKYKILFYLNFIIYGFYGALIPKSIFSFLLITILLIITQLIFGIKHINKTNLIQYKIKYKIVDVIFIFLILILLFYRNFSHSLIGDELSYTQLAIRHSLVISNTITSKFIKFEFLPYKYIILLFNFVILLFMYLLFKIINKLQSYYKISCAVLFLIIFRFFIFKMGGNNSPHPPLNHILTYFISSFIPISDFSIRFAYFIPYLLFTISIYYFLLEKYSKLNSIFLTLTIITIPPLLQFGIMVEQSIFTTYLFTYILIYLIFSNIKKYDFLIFIVSVFVMLRLTSILMFVPIILDFILFNNRKKIFELNITPILIFIPFFLHSLISGTPSFDSSNNLYDISFRIYNALTNGVVFKYMYENIQSYLILLIPISIIFKNLKQTFIIFVTFLIIICTYYSINPFLWGYQKYQIEIFVPFIILGIVNLFDFFYKFNLNIFSYISYIILLIFNNYSLYKININHENTLLQNNINKDYPYVAMYNFIKMNKVIDSSLVISNNYGVLPEVINNYNVKSYKNSKELYEKINNSYINKENKLIFFDSIYLYKNIKYLFIGYIDNKKNVINNLSKSSWKKVNILYGKDSSSIYIYNK